MASERISLACIDAAFRYLSYRPRSEFEVKVRLRKRGFDELSIEKVLLNLREQGLVDDAAFARFWRDNRESFSPRSRAMLRRELKLKGIDPCVIAEVAASIDEEVSAYKAAQKIMKKLALTDYESFCRKLGPFLRRRGFNYEVTKHTVNQLWQERQD